MARCYSERMQPRHPFLTTGPLPAIWLISDRRNDPDLEVALRQLPRGSGFVYRHYHLVAAERQARFAALRDLCRACGHLAVLSGDADTALAWGADGIYGPPDQLGERPGLLRLATVHDAREVLLANCAGVDAMFLSPVFTTRSHPGAPVLGVPAFQKLAALAESPVIALGGMTAARAAQHGLTHWAGIDAFLR